MEKDIFTTKSPEDTQHCKCVKYTGHLSHEAQQVLLSVFVLTHLPEIRDHILDYCLSNISGLSSGVPTIKHILDYCLSNISGLSSGVPTIKHILDYCLSNISGLSSGVPTIKHILDYC
jgi:hypothetical protein